MAWDLVWQRYDDSHFDQKLYEHLLDSTIRIIKQAEPKWSLLYRADMKYSEYWTEDGEAWLKDFFDDDFPATLKENMIDTLSSSANIMATDLKVRYLNVSSFIIEDRNGPCSLTFSQPFFNKKGDKAIVHYEWCNRGELLYLSDADGKWKIEKARRTFEH
jgi:hypothetical protein